VSTRSVRRMRFTGGHCQPYPRTATQDAVATHDAGLVQSYCPKEFRMEVALDGTISIYKRQPVAATVTTADERISLGIDDPRPSRLREQSQRLRTPAAINQRNQEFYSELEKRRSE
jgi:hypothetical protein